MPERLQGKVGIALGSGSARGWAHVGVLRALAERGIRPEIVCGSSAGALVGALYAAGRLDALETFGRKLDWRQMAGYFDLTLRGGLIKARRLVDFLSAEFEDADLSELQLPFACVATDLATGREVWIREGSAAEGLRASIAMPGLVAPVYREGRWLVDGGLVNAVPVSLCRAMGADSVIAVDLDTVLLGRRLAGDASPVPVPVEVPELAKPGSETESTGTKVASAVQELVESVRSRIGAGGEEPARPGEPEAPSIYEVVANALNIMQVRITRSRMAGDPPDVLITPRLGDFGLLDFDRAHEAIAEGRAAVARALGPSEAS